MTRRRATQPVTIPRLRARGDAASCPVTSLCLSRRHEMDPWRSAPSNRAIPGPFSELSFKVSSSRQFTIHGSKKQDGGRRTSLPLDPRQTSPSARPATVIAPDIGMLQSTAHSIPGAPGWCSSSFAGTLRGMGLRRDALRRPLYILHPEVTTPWHLYRLGACRSAEALPCRGGNAGHLEWRNPHCRTSLPSHPLKIQEVQGNGHIHISWVFPRTSTSARLVDIPRPDPVAHCQELVYWESRMSHRL